MSYVENRIRTFDSQVWRAIEKAAVSHPYSSRLLAIPVAIGTLVRDTLATPARCIEEIALTLKSIISLKIDSHIFYAVKYAVLTPFSPLVGLVDAIVSFVKVALSPLRTAKINATKQDFAFYLQGRFSNRNTEKNKFKLKVAQAAFNRFERRVLAAPNNEAVMNTDFVDHAFSRAHLNIEILSKFNKWNEAHQLMLAKKRQQENRIFENGFFQSQMNGMKLKTSWENYCKELVEAEFRLNQPFDIPEFEELIR